MSTTHNKVYCRVKKSNMEKFNLAIFLAYIVCIVNAKDWYETASFYQIYPQTFFDSGSSVKNGTGDLKGIQQKLKYLQDLGVDCLWLTPIFKSTFRSYGYDITDYMDIDPRYGTKTDFDELIQAVHNNGMKIIVDFVPNHCGNAHEFFRKSIAKDETYKDWFVWTDKIGDDVLNKPSNWQSIGGTPGSAWTNIAERNEFVYAQFNPNIPDLNLRNPKVLEYLESVMKFWLDLNIDGFRIDAISHGVEAKADGDGYFPNEARNADVDEDDISNFGYLHHNLTQDQPELFEIVYSWRAFLNKYQIDHNTDVK